MLLATATPANLDRIEDARKTTLDFLELRDVNPFTQRVIKRSRDRLEAEGKLVKIEMVPFGDGQTKARSKAVRNPVGAYLGNHGDLRKRSGFHRRSLGRRHAGKEAVGRHRAAYDHFGSTVEPIHLKGNHGVFGCRLGSNRGRPQQERFSEGTAWKLVRPSKPGSSEGRLMVARGGIEPPTRGFSVLCSAN